MDFCKEQKTEEQIIYCENRKFNNSNKCPSCASYSFYNVCENINSCYYKTKPAQFETCCKYS